jgi:hypothetical protein
VRFRIASAQDASYVNFAFSQQITRKIAEHESNFGFASGKPFAGDCHRGRARNVAVLRDLLCAKALEV